MPVCKLYLLFISADAAQEKEKREESAAAHWCFKVCSPYSNRLSIQMSFRSTSFGKNEMYCQVCVYRKSAWRTGARIKLTFPPYLSVLLPLQCNKYQMGSFNAISISNN
jgi:hypothetical protein